MMSKNKQKGNVDDDNGGSLKMPHSICEKCNRFMHEMSNDNMVELPLRHCRCSFYSYKGSSLTSNFQYCIFIGKDFYVAYVMSNEMK